MQKLSLPDWAGAHAELWALAPQLGDGVAAQVRRLSGKVCILARRRANDQKGVRQHLWNTKSGYTKRILGVCVPQVCTGTFANTKH